MKNGIDNFLYKLRLRSVLKKHVKIDRNFSIRAKQAFLDEFDRKFAGKPVIPYWRRHIWRYSFLSASAILVINGSAIVFADQANVKASSPLYPFKRASESIRLKLASSEQKPYLRYKFAQRRIEEINDLAAATDNSSAEKIKDLSDDFHNQLDGVLDKLDNGNINKIERSKLCQSAHDIVSEYNQASPNYPEDMADLEARCKTNNSRLKNMPDNSKNQASTDKKKKDGVNMNDKNSSYGGNRGRD